MCVSSQQPGKAGYGIAALAKDGKASLNYVNSAPELALESVKIPPNESMVGQWLFWTMQRHFLMVNNLLLAIGMP